MKQSGKKAISIILCMIVLFTLVACGKEKESSEKDPKASDTVGAEDKKKESKEGASDMEKLLDEYKEQLPNVCKAAKHEIYINVPNYQPIEEGYTQMFVMHQSRYVAFTSVVKGKYITLEDAHKAAIDKLIQNIDTYCSPQKLNITTSEKVTINGIEMLRYEGTMACGIDTPYEAYTVGYTFIMDGIPCNLTGSVIDYEQSEELKKEIKDNVEASIKTLRTEKIWDVWCY